MKQVKFIRELIGTGKVTSVAPASRVETLPVRRDKSCCIQSEKTEESFVIMNTEIMHQPCNYHAPPEGKITTLPPDFAPCQFSQSFHPVLNTPNFTHLPSSF